LEVVERLVQVSPLSLAVKLFAVNPSPKLCGAGDTLEELFFST